MFVADTNVLSELMRPQPAPPVSKWARATPIELIFTTSINQAEILVGIATMPAGRRRQALADAAEKMFARLFDGRVLPFDSRCAEAFARILSARRRAGRPIQPFDAQIAAVVAAYGGRIVTRDSADFRDCGFGIVNPWAT